MNRDIHKIGFGTWKIPYGQDCEEAVYKAICSGYRIIDTATAYGNEKSVGIAIKRAISDGIVDRSEIFVTTKLWNSNRSYTKVFKAFSKSMKNLDLDYIDLYLIHWPANRRRYKDPIRVNREVWRGLEELHKNGFVRKIGVSNFLVHHIEEIRQTAELIPMVNQIEVHIGYMQEELIEYHRRNGIDTECYSPLGSGSLLTNKRLQEMAKLYNVNTAILCLSFLRQLSLTPIVKTVSALKMKENLKTITISEEDMKELKCMPYIGGHGHNPDLVDF